MSRGLLILFLLCASVVAAQAVLPKNSEFRKRDILDYRQRKLAEYEQAQKNHEAQMVSKDQAVRQEISLSPWRSTVGTVPGESRLSKASAQKENGFGRQGRKWLFSITALLLVGGGVWWVRIATEDDPERHGNG
jgi:hypothetical protein